MTLSSPHTYSFILIVSPFQNIKRCCNGQALLILMSPMLAQNICRIFLTSQMIKTDNLNQNPMKRQIIVSFMEHEALMHCWRQIHCLQTNWICYVSENPGISVVYLNPLSTHVRRATNLDHVAVSTVACFLPNQSMAVWLRKSMMAVANLPVSMSRNKLAST